MKRKEAPQAIQRKDALSLRGHEDVVQMKESHATLLSQVKVVFVSPLLRAMQTALLTFDASVELRVTRHLAEFDADCYTKEGVPWDRAQKKPVHSREEQQQGRTPSEILGLLGPLADGRSIRWLDIAPHEDWGKKKPILQDEARAHVEQIMSLLREARTEPGPKAVVGHCRWMREAVPFATRPKGTPNPLGTAAHFWPKNSTPYACLLEAEGASLKLLQRFLPTDSVSAHEVRNTVILLRHGHSRAQELQQKKNKVDQ